MEELLLRDQSCLRTGVNTLLTEETKIPQRWTEHFRSVPNRLSTIPDAVVARLPQMEANVDLILCPPSTKPSGPRSSSPAVKRRIGRDP
nr:unnamed protein product [Spirometra erinaceieuropaei]